MRLKLKGPQLTNFMSAVSSLDQAKLIVAHEHGSMWHDVNGQMLLKTVDGELLVTVSIAGITHTTDHWTKELVS